MSERSGPLALTSPSPQRGLFTLLSVVRHRGRDVQSSCRRSFAKLVELYGRHAAPDNQRLAFENPCEERNEIVHRFFHKHWIEMTAPGGRHVMVDELKESIRIISAAYELSETIKQNLEDRFRSNTGNSNEPN